MSVDYNVTFAFSSFAFYTHFRSTFALSYFHILYMFTFALSHFITSLKWQVAEVSSHELYLSFIQLFKWYLREWWHRGVAVGHQTRDQEVAGSSLSRVLRRKNSGQVSHTYVPLSPSSIMWYRRKLGSKQTRRSTRDTLARICGLAV